ncbi:MAG: hypothetical protein HC898_03410 [Phycisphaerales bacterium]|nr:hypothetical protein [Phycisphaerales bacterium]
MPSGSRFTHETTQHRVIALCMFLLLILSLALVWAVSGERRATLAGLSLALPPGWSQAPAPAAGEGVRVVERYIMGEEPQTLNLLLARLDESQAEDLQKASQSVLRQWARRWDHVLQQRRIQREVGGVSVEELRLMGFNRDFIGRRDQLHMLSVINADGRFVDDLSGNHSAFAGNFRTNGDSVGCPGDV